MDYTDRINTFRSNMSKMYWNYQTLDDSVQWQRWDQYRADLMREAALLRAAGFDDEVAAIWAVFGPARIKKYP